MKVSNLHDSLRQRDVVVRDSSVPDETDNPVRDVGEEESVGTGDILLVSGEGETGVPSDGVTHTSSEVGSSHPSGPGALLQSNTVK